MKIHIALNVFDEFATHEITFLFREDGKQNLSSNCNRVDHFTEFINNI